MHAACYYFCRWLLILLCMHAAYAWLRSRFFFFSFSLFFSCLSLILFSFPISFNFFLLNLHIQHLFSFSFYLLYLIFFCILILIFSFLFLKLVYASSSLFVWCICFIICMLLNIYIWLDYLPCKLFICNEEWYKIVCSHLRASHTQCILIYNSNLFTCKLLKIHNLVYEIIYFLYILTCLARVYMLIRFFNVDEFILHVKLFFNV